MAELKVVVAAIALCALLLALSGCTGCSQAVESGASEISVCLEKCSQVCSVVRNSSVDLDGYSIGLEKHSGAMTVKCSCTCS